MSRGERTRALRHKKGALASMGFWAMLDELGEIVERIINRYSNPGDLVLDPFGGLGTVALKAVQMGRRGYTVELNNDYFRDAVGYLKAEDEKLETVSLFDLMEVAE